MHYIETDGERKYSITFLEEERANVAWYGNKDSPESVTYEISEEPVEVEGHDPMKKISFGNFPSNNSYDLSNSNNNSFLIDDTADNIVLRDYKENEEDGIVLSKDYDAEFTSATEEDDIFLVKAE